MEKTGAEARKCERPPGEAASRLIAERPGVSGDGVRRSTRPYDTAAPIKRKSALSDYPLFLGIGRPAMVAFSADALIFFQRAYRHQPYRWP
jgi:hypothetical protein